MAGPSDDAVTAVPIPPKVITAFDKTSAEGGKYKEEFDSPNEQYYAFLSDIIDVSENTGLPPEQQTWAVTFDLIPWEWMETAEPDNDDDDNDTGGKAKPPAPSPASWLIVEDTAATEIAESLGVTVDQVQENEWFLITLGKGTTKATRYYPPRYTKRTSYKTTYVGKYNLRRSVRLKRRFSPHGPLVIKRIIAMLNATPREIGVMDVGQASCNLIYDENGASLLYFDVGLPLFPWFASAPAATFNPGPCLADNPPVVISHIHFDHVSMGLHAANRVQLRNRMWVVPNQHLGGNYNNLFNHQVANLQVWPAILLQINNATFGIIQCNNPNLLGNNNNGLALRVNDIAQNPDRNALLPGDAVFGSIPGVNGIPGLQWMTASHHGSAHHMVQANIPTPTVAGQGRIAYSYGIMPNGNHVYGHPNPPAVNMYHARGWGTVHAREMTTPETFPNSGVAARGNIMMCSNFVQPPGCHVPHCPFHAFPKHLI